MFDFLDLLSAMDLGYDADAMKELASKPLEMKREFQWEEYQQPIAVLIDRRGGLCGIAAIVRKTHPGDPFGFGVWFHSGDNGAIDVLRPADLECISFDAAVENATTRLRAKHPDWQITAIQSQH